jgi:hypothetical protein
MSVALMAFSQAITCSGASPAARATMPLAIDRRHELEDVRPHGGGDDVRRRDFRDEFASWVPEFNARKLSTVRTAGFSPTSCTA